MHVCRGINEKLVAAPNCQHVQQSFCRQIKVKARECTSCIPYIAFFLFLFLFLLYYICLPFSSTFISPCLNSSSLHPCLLFHPLPVFPSIISPVLHLSLLPSPPSLLPPVLLAFLLAETQLASLDTKTSPVVMATSCSPHECTFIFRCLPFKTISNGLTGTLVPEIFLILWQ